MRVQFEPTDPVEAKAIALQVERMLEQIRAAPDSDQLKKIYSGFSAYAGSKRVCSQICEHVQGAFNETAILIKARARNTRASTSQDITNRMTGERD